MQVYNFSLDDESAGFLDRVAEALGVSRAQAVREAIATSAALLAAARQQTVERLAVVRERYGDEAKLIVLVSEGEDGEVLGHVIIDGQELEDVRAVPRVHDGRVLLFLNVLGAGEARPSVLAGFGSETILIPEARVPLGELPWPADPTRALVVRLGDIDELIAPKIKEALQA